MDHWIRCLLFICGLALSASAPSRLALAESTRAANPSTDQLYQLAKKERRNRAQALALITRGLAQNPKHLRLLELRALTLRRMERCQAAIEAYRDFLAADPPRANARKTRRTVANLERVCKKTQLEITIAKPQPGPYRVYLIKKEYGLFCQAAPTCTEGIMPGRYWIVVERDGFISDRQRIRVSNNKTTTHRVELKKHRSRVSVQAPPGAEILIDGKPVGIGDFAEELTVGVHILEVTKRGYAPYSQKITVEKDKPVTLTIELTEYILVRELSPADAELFIDGEPGRVRDGRLLLHRKCEPCAIEVKASGYRGQRVLVPVGRTPPYELAPIVLQMELPVGDDLHSSPMMGRKIAIAGTSALVATTLAMATHQTIQARSHLGEADQWCDSSEDASWICDPKGIELLEAARNSKLRARLYAGMGTAATVGLIVALNLAESQPQRPGMSGNRKLWLGVTTGIGVVGIGTGVFFSLRARSRMARASIGCNNDFACERASFIMEKLAVGDARTSYAAFIAGGAAVTGAVYLWRSTPSPDTGPNTDQTTLTPTIGPGHLGLNLHRAF